MNRFQAMARIMAILREAGHLEPRSREYTLARSLAADLIDLFGPDAAVCQVAEGKARTLEQIQRLVIQRRFEGKMPTITF